MESIDEALFLWLNAPAHPGPLILSLATFLAKDLIWLIPILLAVGWLRGGVKLRAALLVATMAGIVGLAISQGIGLVWWHPRPFMIPVGHNFLTHAPDSSFPSDHLTLWWAVALGLLARHRTGLGGILAILGLPIAWARIYLGVHFPLDMVGGAAVASVSVWLSLMMARWYLRPAFHLAIGIHRTLFGPLIRLGWVRR